MIALQSRLLFLWTADDDRVLTKPTQCVNNLHKYMYDLNWKRKYVQWPVPCDGQPTYLFHQSVLPIW